MKSMRIKTRILSLFMAIVMLLTSVSVMGFIMPAMTASGAVEYNWDDALHFYIRHWHSFIDDEALYQGDSNDGEKNKYFVLVEGYIKPVKDENGEISSYEFYMVNQDSNAGGSDDNPKYFKYGDGNGDNELNFTLSPYIEDLDEATGTITLSKRPLMDGDDALEKYAGLSISTGRRAITEKEDGTIVINYDKYIHLVKGHAFYIPWQMIVDGSSATTVDGDTNKLESLFDDEIDTANVYTYINNAEDNSYSAGEIVMSATDDTQACVSKDDLPEGVKEEDVQLSKFYCTAEGMHTDNTVTALDDGRTFISNLEAWYVEGHAPEVGMVLDASGSMAFPVDTPTPIHLDETEIKKLGIKQLTTDPNSGDDSWNNYFLDDETLAKLLNPRNTDNSMVGVSGYSYFAYGKDGYVPIGYWEGADAIQPSARLTFTNDASGNTPRLEDKLGNLRSWLYDEITNNHASRITPQVEDLSGPYEFEVAEVEDWPKGDLKFSGTYGLQLGSYLNHSGVLLDTKPSGGSFSFTFELVINPTGTGQIEVLYIGPMSSDSDSGYFRLYYDTATGKLHGSQTSSGEPSLTSEAIDKAANTKRAVTLVFENADTESGSVALYIDGKKTGSGALTTPITDSNVIIAGVKGTYSHNGQETDAINIDTFTLYNFAISSSLVDMLSSGNSIPTIATRGDGRTLASINRTNIPNYGEWSYEAILSHTQAGWYYITHAGLFDTHYNAIGTGKRMYGISGKTSKATFYDITYESTEISGDTGYSYTSTREEPIKFYVDGDGYLRCFYLNAATYSNASNAICSYVYNLTDAQYVRTEVLRRAAGMFVTDLNAQSPAAKVSAVRFSTNYIKFGYYYYNKDKPNDDSNNNKLVFKENGEWVYADGTAVSNTKYVSEFDELPMLLLQDWTNDTIESAAMLSMNYGDDTPQYERGGARAYTKSTAHGLPQYNYGLTGSTDTWSGIQSYINTLEEYTDEDSPKYLIIFTDGKDTRLRDTSKVYIQLGKDADLEIVEAGNASEKLTDYLKKKGYTIFTVLLDGEDMPEDSSDFKDAVEFLTTISGPGKREGEEYKGTDYNKRKKDGNYFFSLNFSVDDRKNELARAHEEFVEKYGPDVTYSMLDGSDKAIIDEEFRANYTATDILTEIFTDEILGEMTSPLTGYTVKSYIDPRFDLQDSNGTVWHLNAGGKIVKGDGSGTNGTITVNSTSKAKFKLTGDMNANAKEPYLRYDAKEDMYYLEWVNQTIPTSAVGAQRLAVWNALYTLKAKDDFIGGNAILTNGNKASMNWVYHPGDLPLDDAADVADNPSAAETEPFGFDANSGTSDSKKEIDSNGIVLDEYPSKGFPRTTVNVQLLPIETNPLSKNIYMGEVISPMQLLLDLEDQYFTDSYYLDYLKRYAYQRYVKESDQELKKELDMPLLDLLTEWLEIEDDRITQKEFSIPYSYLPDVEYNSETGKVDLNEKGTAKTVYNNTGGVLHEQDIVGILTYRWEQLDPDPEEVAMPIMDAVKDNTERAMYSITAEFTPLKVGDTLDILDDAVETSGETTADDLPIAAAVELDGGEVIPARVRDGIFATYIPIVGAKKEFTNSYLFDREKYINEKLVIETHETEDENGETVTKSYYKWNKKYKPTADGTEQVLDIPLDDPDYPYGDATFLNSGRTLSAFSVYTLDVVSGDIILELKMLIGELEKAAEKAGVKNDDDHFKTDFTIDATRSFTDTDFVERLRAIKNKNGEAWEDYATDLKFTFELDYTKADIAKLRETLKNPAPDEVPDPNGYVSAFAKVKSIKVKYGYGEDGADTWTDLDLADIAELPIGTYVFSLNSLGQDDNDILHFSTVGIETNSSNFRKAYSYFDKLVLRGLATTNENPIKWLETDDEEEPETIEQDGEKEYEITEEKVYHFAAKATSKDDKATFYLGTDTSGKSSKRGNSTNIGEKLYIDYRLGIILLTTGMTRLTVREEGAQSNESFIYKITGKTYGDVPVEMTITVQGGGETTVELPPGEYTVTEISNPDNSDWSWRYENKNTYGGSKEDEENLEGWTIGDGDDEVTADDLKYASTELWHSASDPELKDHKTVTFEHKRNEKVWLGGENHQNNKFTFSNAETE